MIENKNELELYFHIPFCVKKCSYCDFLSAPATRQVQEAYMAALFAELEERAAQYSEYKVISVFIGGGTPSVVESKWIRILMDKVRCFFSLEETAEVTIEVNPGTVDHTKLTDYHNAGINRLSIGLQSAKDQELRRLGRIHTFAEFQETYKLAREAGFSNINVDVMSALPGQSLESYRDTLRAVLALQPVPEHISAYSLIVEEGTPFARQAAEGKLELPEEDCERKMYEETKRLLGEAGFHRYEISNYAREGYVCRHNCGYWERRNYLGLGIGAASLVGNCRFQNGRDLTSYLEHPSACVESREVLSEEEQMEETMFLGLRKTEGVSERSFRKCFGRGLLEVYGSVVEQNIRDGLLYLRTDPHTGERFLALTQRGLDVSNYVMAQFLFDGD